MSPSISVITPCRNMARFLETCIQSVVQQSYPRLQYLVIDGGSTDSTVDIIRHHANHIDCWVSEADSGQSAAINKGFARATGDIVCWLNADDYFLPGALNAVASAYARRPDAPFYFGDGLRIDEAGRTKSGFFPDGIVRFHRPALLHGLNYILQPASFINRRHLLSVGFLDEHLHFGMDSDLWMRLAGVGVPEAIQSKLAASREYESTKTSTGSFERIEELREIARRHTGMDMTPGVLCYFYDELLKYSQRNPGLFSDDFTEGLTRLWAATAHGLARFGARPDGFPLKRLG